MSASDLPPVPPPRRATRTAVIAALVVVAAFASGVLAGVVLERFMLHRGERRVPRAAARLMVERLDRKLDLTDAQRAEVEKILRRRHQRMERIWSKVGPEVTAEIEATNREIERILTPEQRETFAKVRMRLRGHGHRRGPPPR